MQWEYRDFVYKGWQPGETWARLGSGGYTEPGARLYFWQNRQQAILAELQKWLDQGWEPVSEVGPGGFALRSYRAIKPTALDRIGYIFTFGGFLLLDLINRNWYVEPTEFRVQMRRPKK